jgi:cytochrome c2
MGSKPLVAGGVALAMAIIAAGLVNARPMVFQTPVPSLRLLVADARHGQELFERDCQRCHTVQAGGPNEFGPHLHGLFGRQAGTVPGYNFSAAMRASGIVWSAQTLDAYLANPHQDIPGDKMPFAGLPTKADRDDLIGYLEQATR